MDRALAILHEKRDVLERSARRLLEAAPGIFWRRKRSMRKS
jgi:hypothetical protein